MEQVTMEFQGKQSTASLNRGGPPSGEVRSEPPMWYVTISGTSLTKLPASSSDSEAAVKRKVLAWLEAHPDMLDRDQIVLGGG